MKFVVNNIDMTAVTGNLSWQNTLAEISTTLSFETPKSDARHTNIFVPQAGNIVQMYTFDEMFRGIILSVDDGNPKVNKYTVADFGWYLNKSKETYQFNSMPAYKAITKVCADFNIPIHIIPELNQLITKIYFDKTISEIIVDILELCGGGYNYDITAYGLRVYKIGEIVIQPNFKLSPNTKSVDSVFLRGIESHSVSMEEMKNSIKVITEKDEKYTVQKVLRDEDSISKYGLLQEVIKIDPEKENANTVATQNLAELNKLKETYSFEIIEDVNSYTRAGYVIPVNGHNYVIESSSHSIKKCIHYVKLDLRKVD